MKFLFWTAFMIVLLDLSKSQEVEIPCKLNVDCETLSNAPAGVTCIDGLCKCPDELGNPQNCATINTTSPISNSSRSTSGLVGRYCTSETECVTAAETHAHCNKTRKQCQCSTGFVASLDFNKCLPAIELGQSGCEITKQCESLTANSTCLNGSCGCAQGLHYDSKACWINKEFGAVCSSPEECSNVRNATCDSQSRCSCPPNMVIHPEATSCLLIASKIEDSCMESIQCTQLLGEGGECMEQRCRCHEHHHFSALSQKCLKNLNFGDPCERDDECSHGANDEHGHGPMRCSEKRCACAENFQNNGGVTCEPAVLQKDPNSAANQLSNVSVFALALSYFVLLSLVL